MRRRKSQLKVMLLPAAAIMALADPADGPPDLPEGFTLSDPIWFSNDIGSSICHLLRFDDRPVGYVATIRRAGENLVLRRCERTEGERQFGGKRRDGTDWVRGSAAGWFLVQPGVGEPTPINLAGVDHFSNPQPCGNRIAYWAKGDLASSVTHSHYFAHVGDLLTQEILARRYMGPAWMATDYVFHQPPPQWNEDCTEARFHNPRYFDEPATLRLRPREAG